MKFSTTFTLAATTLFMIIGSTDAHLRGRRSLETTDDVSSGCTGASQDPFALGKDNKVPCCAGLEEELKDWDGDGKYYYKCMAKETGNFKCWNQGCPDHGGALAPCVSKTTGKNICVDSKTCAQYGMGLWLDCSDENRMLEVKEVTGTSNNDNHRSLETTDDVGGGCTGASQDPFALGKDNKVPCCAGLKEELKDWDGDGKYYYKCMAKETGNFKCWNQGCPDHGGALAPCVSKTTGKNICVDSKTCAQYGMGLWLDCSDENRMI